MSHLTVCPLVVLLEDIHIFKEIIKIGVHAMMHALLEGFGYILKIRHMSVFLFLPDREVGMLPPGKQASSRETKDELCVMDTLSTKLLNK